MKQPHQHPLTMVRGLWGHRELIGQFTKRQIQERYRGSYLGLLWSVITPLAMLAVYTLVFSVIFQARWAEIDLGSRFDYALFLFAGLIPFNIVSETSLDASRLILARPNLVKRVIFPLEILPVSLLLSVFVQSLLNLSILLIAMLVLLKSIPLSLLYLPLVYLPLLFLCQGLAWFLASLGVFLRDLDPFLRIFLQILFFLTPIIYPFSAVPVSLQRLLWINPLTYFVAQFRDLLLQGRAPAWGPYGVLAIISIGVFWAGYLWFVRSKKAFGDVV